MTCQNQNCENENFQRRKILWQMYHLLEEMENQSQPPRNAFPFGLLERGIDLMFLGLENGAEWLTDKALLKLKRFRREPK